MVVFRSDKPGYFMAYWDFLSSRRGLRAFFATAGRRENQPFAQLLFRHGLQQPDGIETDLGAAIGKLRQEESHDSAAR